MLIFETIQCFKSETNNELLVLIGTYHNVLFVFKNEVPASIYLMVEHFMYYKPVTKNIIRY